MIRATSLTVGGTGYESMNIAGQVDPANNTKFFAVDIFRNNLSVEEQATYDACVNLLSTHCNVDVINTIAKLDIGRVTSQDLLDGKSEVDFNTLPTADQDILRDFLNLVVSKEAEL